MRYVVLYAASCPACSEVARLVGNASITDLEARPFEDPQVTESLRKAGLVAPDRPSLMVIGDTDVQVLSGWAMRRRLAGLVGWRRSRTIVRLLAAEWRARLAKSAASSAASYVPSRRGVIGGVLAGLAGWAMNSGVANASATPPAGTPAMKPADPAAAARVLQTATAQRAVRAWGPAAQEVLEISGGSQPVLVLTHLERDIYTFIDNSPGAHSNEPVAISLGAAPTAEHALRYYTVNGGALADVKLSGGQAIVTPVQPGIGEAVPDISKWQIACWLGCIGRKTTSPGCITACDNCFYYSVGSLARLIACTQCAVCAGPNGVACLRECNII
jgi:hypothetical protein